MNGNQMGFNAMLQPMHAQNHQMVHPRVPGMHVFRNITPKSYPHYANPPSYADHQQISNGFKVPPSLVNRIQNSANPKPQQYGSMEVTPIYSSIQGLHQMPSVSSMISPPMENQNSPNWHRNQFGASPENDQSSAFFAMSSYLDRSAETPAPIPLECTLGTETPSPSLPSNTPPNEELAQLDPNLFDTSEFLRMTFQDEEIDDDNNYIYRTPARRHRRTKAEINKAKLEEMKRMMKPLKVSLTPMAFGGSVRVFRDKSGNPRILREGLPRVPRMKKVSGYFIPIVNIAFQRNQKGIILTCNTKCCRFKTYNSEKFREHLQGHDPKTYITGKCSICHIGFKENSLLLELRHLVLDHLLPNRNRIPCDDILYSKVLPLEPWSDDDTDEYESESPLASPEIDPPEIFPEDNEILNEITETSPVKIASALSTDHINLRKKASQPMDDETLAIVALFSDELGDLFSPDSNEGVVEEPDSDYNPDAESEEEIATLKEPSSMENSTSDSDTSNESSKFPLPTKTLKRNQKLTEKAKETDDINLFKSLRRDKKHKKQKKKSRREDNRRKSPEKERIILKISTQSIINKIAEEKSNKRPRTVSEEKSLEVGETIAETSLDCDGQSENESLLEERPPKIQKIDNDETESVVQADEKEEEADEKEEEADEKEEEAEEKEEEAEEPVEKDEPAVDTDFLNRIPTSLIEKIKMSKMKICKPTTTKTVVMKQGDITKFLTPLKKECPEKEHQETIPGGDNEPAEPIDLKNLSDVEMDSNTIPKPILLNSGMKIEILEDVIFDPEGKTKKKHGQLPSARKSTSKSTNLMMKLKPTARKSISGASSPNLSIKNCSVKLRRCGVPNKSDDENVAKKTSKYISKSAETIDPITTMFSDTCGTKVSSHSQNDTFEKQEESEKGIDIELPFAEKDLPDVVNDSRINKLEVAAINSNENSKEKKKDEGEEEIFYDSVEAFENHEASESLPALTEDILKSLEDSSETKTVETKTTGTRKLRSKTNLSRNRNSTSDKSKKHNEEKTKKVKKSFEKSQEKTKTADKTSRTDEIIPSPIEKPSKPAQKTSQDTEKTKENESTPEKLFPLPTEYYPLMEEDDIVTHKKTKTAIQEMENHEYLTSTYKCMSSRCSFSTYVWIEFKTHMKTHVDSDKLFVCSTCLSTFDQLEKIDENDKEEEDGLFEHLENFHRFDRFQCSKCMYRTCEKLYCDRHRQKFHSKEDPKPLILRGAQLMLKKHREECKKTMQKKMKKQIKPINCKFCPKTFYLLDEYFNHLQVKSEEQSNSTGNSIVNLSEICNEIVKVQQMQDKEICDYGVFRCLYCTDGFNQLELMKDHLSELHSNEMAFMAEIRQIHDIETDTNSSSNVFLRDLINEKSEEIKNIKVKFSDKSKSFYEKNQSSMHVVKTADNKKRTDKLKPGNVLKDHIEPSTSTEADAVEKKQIEKPLFLIGEIYSLQKEP